MKFDRCADMIERSSNNTHLSNFEILLELVVFILVVLQALIISLVSLVPVLEGRRSRRVAHLVIFFVDSIISREGC